MRSLARYSAAIAVLVLTLLAPAATSAATLPELPGGNPSPPESYGQGDFGGFRNILPPGTNGFDNALDAAQFLGAGSYPPHSQDQLSMYEDLVYATPGLTASDIDKYFKDASFGVRPATSSAATPRAAT